MPRGVYERTPDVVAKQWSPERRKRASERLAERNRATPMSVETRQKKAEALIGRKCSEEHVAAMRAAWTPEKRQARSEQRIGIFRGEAAAGSFITAAGYRMLTDQHDHPLAHKGALLEHRKVLYDKIGPIPHFCHWECGKLLGWNDIYADHVDGDRINNGPENLVPSCVSCNFQRGKAGNPVDWRAK